jgi:hypothetical protein
MRSFNVRSLRRERPDNPELMRHIISEAISVDAPLSFVSYWGKGPRSRLARPDIQCLDLLAAMVSRIRRVYPPGATIRLVFTDTHAELNGHSPESIRSYFGDVEAAARKHGFEACLLTDVLWTAELLGGLRHQTPVLTDDLLLRLVAFATKWYRGGGTPEDGARNYYRLNMMEKQAVELAFPRSIFITFNSSDVRTLLPERLPIFFMYSIKRGVSNKPWFLPDPAIPEAMTGT